MFLKLALRYGTKNLKRFRYRDVPVPCISESFIKIKINLIFFFTLLCGASKGFRKALKGLHKTFKGITKKLENEKLG